MSKRGETDHDTPPLIVGFPEAVSIVVDRLRELGGAEDLTIEVQWPKTVTRGRVVEPHPDVGKMMYVILERRGEPVVKGKLRSVPTVEFLKKGPGGRGVAVPYDGTLDSAVTELEAFCRNALIQDVMER